LVETTVDYSHGNVEWNESGLTNVTFKQSFVIENAASNIYSAEGSVYIALIHNGLLRVRNSPYIGICG
jgi:hypothetical protein